MADPTDTGGGYDAEAFEDELTARYGPLLSNDTLRIALGYTSKDALRQALARGTVPIPIFSIPHRRGKYALTKDLALWLTRSRARAVNDRNT